MPKFNKITIGLLLACASLAGAQATGVASTFDTDADGWFVSNFNGVGNGAVNWADGAIQTDDQFAETSFHAPAKFNGDWSSLYGATLSFDLTENGRDAGADAYYTAIIASGTSVLYWYGGAPSTSFTSFVATLSVDDARWRLGGSGFSPASGVAPTQTQFQGILGNITRLQINAEFITGPDNTRLDNVVLGAVPEPQSVLLFALGAGFLAATQARRQRAAKARSAA